MMSTETTAPASGAAKIVPARSWAGEFRALIKLGWPLVVAQVAQNALFTTDVIMLGWLGKTYLSAAALANALFIVVQVFGTGVVGAVAPMVAQSLGAGDLRSVRRTVRQGIWVALILGVLVIPLLWNIKPIYLALHQDPELTALAEVFVHYGILLSFPSFMIIVFRSFLAAHGYTRVILLITIAGVLLNAVLDYALIFGHFGFPRLELAGSAITTTVVNLLMLLMMAGYVVWHRRLRRYHIFHRLFEADWPRFWQLWRIGLPIGAMIVAEVAMFTFSSLLQGALGKDEVAAHAIALQITSLFFMVPFGLSQATTVRVGIALGEHDKVAISRSGWTALSATLLFQAACGFCFFFGSRYLVGVFLDPNDPANFHVFELATSYMIVAAFFQLFDGTQVSMAAALRGLTDTRVPLLIALFGYWIVGFPVAWLFGFPLGFRGVGIWIGLAAGLAATGVILVTRFALRERLGITSKAAV